MTTVRALRTPPNTDDMAAAVAPAINGEAKEVIAETAQPSATPVQAPPLGQGAVAAVMRAVDDSCEEIQRTVDMMIDRLGTRPLVIQLPIGSEDKYEGVVDLIQMKEIIWKGEELGAKFDTVDIRPELQEAAKAEQP